MSTHLDTTVHNIQAYQKHTFIKLYTFPLKSSHARKIYLLGNFISRLIAFVSITLNNSTAEQS